MSLTTDNHDKRLKLIRADGQQECYLILPESERAKGFIRPVRDTYQHRACGGVTHMGLALAETYARDPLFYGGTFCVNCGAHFDLTTPRAARQRLAMYAEGEAVPDDARQFSWNFVWIVDGRPDGSYVGE